MVVTQQQAVLFWRYYPQLEKFLSITTYQGSVEIDTFLTKLELCMQANAAVVALVLQQQNDAGENIGHILVRYQKAQVAHDYLALLKNLMPSQPQEVIAILQQQTSDGQNIGHSIAHRKSAPVVQAYLALLKDLMPSQPQEVIAILQQQTSDGQNIGHSIACYQNGRSPKVAQAYLALLTDLMQQNPQVVIAILQQQTDTGCNIGHSITHYEDLVVAQAYLALLTDLMQQNPQEVIAILQQQTDTGWNIGHTIAFYTSDAINGYLDILSTLAPLYPVDVFSVLTAKLSNSSDPAHQEKIKTTGVDLSNLFANTVDGKAHVKAYNKVFLDAFLAILDGKQPVAVANYIKYSTKVTELLLALPVGDPKALTLLQRCMDKNSALGKYCHTHGGMGFMDSFFYGGATTMSKKLLARLEEFGVLMTQNTEAQYPGQPATKAATSTNSMMLVSCNGTEYEMQVLKKSSTDNCVGSLAKSG